MTNSLCPAAVRRSSTLHSAGIHCQSAWAQARHSTGRRRLTSSYSLRRASHRRARDVPQATRVVAVSRKRGVRFSGFTDPSCSGAFCAGADGACVVIEVCCAIPACRTSNKITHQFPESAFVRLQSRHCLQPAVSTTSAAHSVSAASRCATCTHSGASRITSSRPSV
jgi:hypothetical protein